jgi:hypothetical protein
MVTNFLVIPNYLLRLLYSRDCINAKFLMLQLQLHRMQRTGPGIQSTVLPSPRLRFELFLLELVNIRLADRYSSVPNGLRES